MPGMTTHAGHSHALTDPIALALTNLASADHHAEAARDLRERDEHAEAGKRRESERLCLKRAEILAEIAQAQALDGISEALHRIALAQ
jgi:hypothetical protein